jgi:hypothetical protein
MLPSLSSEAFFKKVQFKLSKRQDLRGYFRSLLIDKISKTKMSNVFFFILNNCLMFHTFLPILSYIAQAQA